MQVSMELNGLDKLDTKLAKLGSAVGKKALRGAMMKATSATTKKAKAITPIGHYKPSKLNSKQKHGKRTPGTLRKSIVRKTMVGRIQDNHSMAVRIRFNSKKAYYWLFVTGGTNSHDLNDGSKRAVRRRAASYVSLKSGMSRKAALLINQQVGRWGKRAKSKRLHPGTKGRDILGIAFRVTKKNMTKVFADDLARRIEKAV